MFIQFYPKSKLMCLVSTCGSLHSSLLSYYLVILKSLGLSQDKTDGPVMGEVVVL